MVKRNSSPVHIRGLVKAMNIARQNLEVYSRRGLTSSELKTFAEWVQSILAQTEQICRQNKIHPDQLPAPSYRAYEFLKALNISALKPTEKPETDFKVSGEHVQEEKPSISGEPPKDLPESSVSPQKQVRVTNLIKICDYFHTRLAETASPAEKGRKTRRQAVNRLLAEFQETADQVEQICRDEEGSPSNLPAPSRRAYQWVKFLSTRENLEMHLDALRWVFQASGPKHERRLSCQQKIPGTIMRQPFYFEFFNLPAVYRIRPGVGAVRMTASEGFISAPPDVIEALICMAYLRDRGDYQATVQNYADSEEFSEILLAMEWSIEDTQEASKGRVYDLDKIFQNVNAQYFQNQLERPKLTWNQTLTYRKLGHYLPANDTVMISITLDRPQVPRSVVEFVMYHELLHKALGIKITNGRHYAHHKDFREAEARFQHYVEAKEWMSHLGARKLE